MYFTWKWNSQSKNIIFTVPFFSSYFHPNGHGNDNGNTTNEKNKYEEIKFHPKDSWCLLFCVNSNVVQFCIQWNSHHVLVQTMKKKKWNAFKNEAFFSIFHILCVALFRYHREQNFTSYSVLNIISLAWTVMYLMDSQFTVLNGDWEQNLKSMNELIKQTNGLELVIGHCHLQIECSKLDIECRSNKLTLYA